MILRKSFVEGQKALLYNSRFKLMPGKLHSCWIHLFEITKVFPFGAAEIKRLETNQVFKVNDHRLKHFYDGFKEQIVEELQLMEPVYYD